MPLCFLQQGSTNNIKEIRNFWYNKLEIRNDNFPFCLKVWISRNQLKQVCSSLPKICQKYYTQKLELLRPQNRYICHQGVIWKINGKFIYFLSKGPFLFLVLWHVTCDAWHMTCVTWHTGSDEYCQNFRFLDSMIWVEGVLTILNKRITYELIK